MFVNLLIKYSITKFYVDARTGVHNSYYTYQKCKGIHVTRKIMSIMIIFQTVQTAKLRNIIKDFSYKGKKVNSQNKLLEELNEYDIISTKKEGKVDSFKILK